MVAAVGPAVVAAPRAERAGGRVFEVDGSRERLSPQQGRADLRPYGCNESQLLLHDLRGKQHASIGRQVDLLAFVVAFDDGDRPGAPQRDAVRGRVGDGER